MIDVAVTCRVCGIEHEPDRAAFTCGDWQTCSACQSFSFTRTDRVGEGRREGCGVNLSDVPADRRCNAKTRAGLPCRNWGIRPSGRCRLHGGKSYRGVASPRFRHGRYSRDPLGRLLWHFRRELGRET